MISQDQLVRRVAECPHCGGTGLRARIIEDLSIIQALCPLCDGKGECADTREHRMRIEAGHAAAGAMGKGMEGEG